MNNKRLILIFTVIIIILCLIYNNMPDEKISNSKYIRFHVIANSDSAEDQALKLRIRDRLLDEIGGRFDDKSSIDDARTEIRHSLNDIEKIANEEIKKSNKKYSAVAQVGYFDFPIKAYGNLVLPAGKYEALRVVLGEGKGANWWCVMFPPLCFVDISHGTAEQTNKKDAESTLDEHTNIDSENSHTDNEHLGNDYEHMENGYVNTENINEQTNEDMEEKTEHGFEHTGGAKKHIEIEYRFKSEEWFKKSFPEMTKMFSLMQGWSR